MIPLDVVLARYHLTNAHLGVILTYMTSCAGPRRDVRVRVHHLLERIAGVLLTDQSQQTLTVWLSSFYGTPWKTDWGGLMAASTLRRFP